MLALHGTCSRNNYKEKLWNRFQKDFFCLMKYEIVFNNHTKQQTNLLPLL